MSDDNKDISASSSFAVDNNKTSLLPEYVIAILNKGTKQGFIDDRLSLQFKGIKDFMLFELCEWLIKLDDKVKVLDLSKNPISSTGASMLFDMLRTINSSIKWIWLNENRQMDDKCMKSLGEYIKSNKSIEGVWLCWNTISDAGIEILAPYIEGSATFKLIALTGNKRITNKSIPLLMKMIESSHMEDIGVLITSITQKGIIHSSLASNTFKLGWNSLSLHGKEINDDDIIRICEMMKKYGIDKLKQINLKNNSSITSKGASVLFDTMKECNSAVSILNLTGNQLDDKCIKQLGEYVQDNWHFEELGLGSKVTDKGIEILSEYLIGNTVLKELSLSHNKRLTDASAPYLVEIAKTSCITIIGLLDTSISDEIQQEIEAVLSIPIDQREIPIKSKTKSAAKIQSTSASAST